MPDLDATDIRTLLSAPASGPAHLGRRRFLQGALAAGSLAAVPGWADRMAAAATPVGLGEGILVILHLGGGNDGLNTVVPRADSRYRSLRRSLAITNPLPLSATHGFHPALAKLRGRYDAGKVAIVHGVGVPGADDLSHFSSTATWMAGAAGSSRTTGWLGRWLDGVPDATEGLRAVTVGASVPLHLVGRRSTVTALDAGGALFGADRSEGWAASVYDTVAAFGDGPTGKGVWADRIAAAGARSVALAGDLRPAFTPALPDSSLVSQLTLAARLINADLGIRVLDVSLGSFDTHEGQAWRHDELLRELDAGIAAFYATLQSRWSKRVALLSFSEFGRHPAVNGSGGCDHGTSSVLMVIGDNVKGGMHGTPPRLDQLDRRGDPKVTVDFRRVYTTVLDRWLAGDAAELIGSGAYQPLDLFRASPGGSPVPVYSPSSAWAPFATPSDLVRQLYLDLYAREGDPSGIAYWTAKLVSGARSVSSVVDAFLHSTEFGRSVAPVARMAIVGLDGPPSADALLGWAAKVRTGTPVADLATQVVARPEFAARYGSLGDAQLVDQLHRKATGTAPNAATAAELTAGLQAGSLTVADVLARVSALDACARRLAPEVEVAMTYTGLLRRTPDPSGWSYWVGKVRSGTSITRLVAQFVASSEYRRRFVAA